MNNCQYSCIISYRLSSFPSLRLVVLIRLELSLYYLQRLILDFSFSQIGCSTKTRAYFLLFTNVWVLSFSSLRLVALTSLTSLVVPLRLESISAQLFKRLLHQNFPSPKLFDYLELKISKVCPFMAFWVQFSFFQKGCLTKAISHLLYYLQRFEFRVFFLFFFLLTLTRLKISAYLIMEVRI